MNMTSSMVIPVVDVHINNFKELWGAIVLAMKTSSFIALDTELSGLGSRKALLAESIEDRYKAICHAARSRSILSLGIACYKKLENKVEQTYLVQVYNLTLLCSEEYVIEPQSVQFLVQHGFDFNKQYAKGVPYYKGNDKGGDAHGVNMRTLFVELLRSRKPLVVHNGLIDMVFLYQCFYAHLPERLGTFTTDLSQMFPAGIYDTKYATEYELRFTASYLEYAYKKCKLENCRSIKAGNSGPHLFMEFCEYTGNTQNYVDFRTCTDGQNDGDTLDICIQFSAYGWCPNGTHCAMSHDTDLIILQDEKNKEDKRNKRKRKRKQKASQESAKEDRASSPQSKQPNMENTVEAVEGAQDGDAQVEDHSEAAKASHDGANSALSGHHGKTVPNTAKMDSVVRKVEAGSHRAGFDAFMTGFIFSYASCLLPREKESVLDTWLPGCLNKLYLSGKSVPLYVAKSTFSKSSKAHMHKMDTVWGKSPDGSVVKV
ncbi:target of EGR1 protein 1 isoform X2 [Denticeps clupeoides]|uniref:target of EGR1 protein 1 isoform X2 n=1 Tax=Denticeps clupeoides TaxID=299321 RepID=UPI0010A3BCEA|nr:target of EGR1 protein 1 isoform X2 [Denticeps clupeoides]